MEIKVKCNNIYCSYYKRGYCFHIKPHKQNRDCPDGKKYHHYDPCHNACCVPVEVKEAS